MKFEQVQIGGHYYARVSGQLVIVEVLAIREVPTRSGRRRVLDVLNLRTGRKLVFRSATRLRRGVKPVPKPVSPGGGA